MWQKLTVDDANLKPVIPSVDYIVKFHSYYTTTMFRERTPKVCMKFEILAGPYTGIMLERFHSVGKLYGEPGVNGRFKPKSQTCQMMMEFCRCFPDQEITRLDRLPMTRWDGRTFRATVRTVKENHTRE